ncbi:neutrophil gelatinase-associated lipocalin-like [Suricata suricatta]|uniref:neutrophil gelatinase-associated lipocalin-like n=1 Tax=Suricata suricatta TaxID=37032 RepID=UPI0011553825|nr:neutrophil gelatinase-associated lipocalin-like [Suricata suricatta]
MFLNPEVMVLGLLWLSFTILVVLQIQARDSPPNLIPAPLLQMLPLQPDFQNELYMQVGYIFRTSTWNRRYDQWFGTFIPNWQPGQFKLVNLERYPGIQDYTARVVATDYNQSAMVFFKKYHNNQAYFNVNLYGRTKRLTQELKENFIRFAKSLGLTDDHIIILLIPIGNH